MNMTNVAELFSDFRSSQTEFVAGFDAPTPNPAVVFQTNITHGIEMIYFPPKGGGFFAPFECCYVYFDTNGMIAGYRYSRDH